MRNRCQAPEISSAPSSSSNNISFRPNLIDFGRKLFAVSTDIKCISAGTFPDDKAFFGEFFIAAKAEEQCKKPAHSSVTIIEWVNAKKIADKCWNH